MSPPVPVFGRLRWVGPLALLSVSLLSAAEPLRLIATAEGVTHAAFTHGPDGFAAATPAGPRVLPAHTEWRLEGDLAAHARFLRYSPAHSVQVISHRRSPLAGASGFSHSAMISLSTSPRALPPWRQGEFEGAVVVFVWVAEGRAVRAAAVPVARSLNPQDRQSRITFLMDEEEARGFPAILLWKEGAFLAPEPQFRDEAANAWLQAMMLPPQGGALPPLTDRIARATARSGVTLLHIAAEAGRDAAVDALLGAKARVDARTDSRASALDWAAACGRNEAVRRLLAANAPVNEIGFGSRPLRLAVEHRHDATAALLVAAGARFDVAANRRTPIALATELGLVRTLRAIAAKGGFTIAPEDRNDQLAAAVRRGSAELVEFFLELGAEAGHRVDGVPLLTLAARRSDDGAAVAALLAAGAKPAVADRDGVTALSAAVTAGSAAGVSRLLAAGADPNHRDRLGRTALHYGVAGTSPGIVTALLAAGADPAAADQTGRTPLGIALDHQSRPMLAALVGAGARLDLQAAGAGDRLAAAVMLDQIELLRRAVADGWDRRTLPGSPWAPLALARLATAGRAANLLAEVVADPAAIPLPAAGDRPPVRLSGASPVDPRVEEVEFPAVQVTITAIVETDGRLSHVLAGTPHDRLRAATLGAVRGWRFKPAERQGRPLALAIQFPVQFPARDNRLHSLNDVERQPELQRSGPLLEELAERLQSGGAYLRANSRVGLVVERDGTTSRVTLPELLPADYADLMRRVVSGARFTPALREGRPVRVWIELDVGYDLRITYVVDESHRFNLEPAEN